MANILSHIAGVVSKVETSVGAQVAVGDVVVVLESMKMLIQIEAEDAGRVTEIRCSEGQAVDEGEVLVVVE